MKLINKIIVIIILLVPISVSANIMCKDGTTSPSCLDCHRGCCSHHGGCASKSITSSNGNKKSNEVTDNVGNASYKIVNKENDYDYGILCIIGVIVIGSGVGYYIYKKNNIDGK